MKNIMFTIDYPIGNDSLFEKFLEYNSILQLLLITHIQKYINPNLKIKKMMISLYPEPFIEDMEIFKKHHYNKKPWQGIVNIELSLHNIVWNKFSDKEKKEYLIKLWIKLFNELSDNYFLVKKNIVIQELYKLIEEEWTLRFEPLKKKIKHNNSIYRLLIEMSTEAAKLYLINNKNNELILEPV